MTSVWQLHSVQDKVESVLDDLRSATGGQHHLGRPYMTAYQLAIRLHQRYPEVAQALNVEVGGVGVGSRNSLAQYLARELSGRISRYGDDYPIEGAYLTNDAVAELSYVGPSGERIESSLTGSGFDLSMFRLRP